MDTSATQQTLVKSYQRQAWQPPRKASKNETTVGKVRKKLAFPPGAQNSACTPYAAPDRFQLDFFRQLKRQIEFLPFPDHSQSPQPLGLPNLPDL